MRNLLCFKVKMISNTVYFSPPYCLIAASVKTIDVLVFVLWANILVFLLRPEKSWTKTKVNTHEATNVRNNLSTG